MLDTNVLMPQTLRDVLRWLADERIYQPVWSQRILNELEWNLVRVASLPPERVVRLIHAMREAFPDAMVPEWPEARLQILGNDPGDRHVLAAAIESGASCMVTQNLRHFPSQFLAPYGLRAISADEFLVHLLNAHRQEVMTVIEAMSHAYSRPPLSAAAILEALSRITPRFSAAALG